MRYYLIAGEASGDLHAQRLISELKVRDNKVEIRYYYHPELAYMGFIAPVVHIREILRNIKKCQKDILSFKPDILVLIDYAGFNLRVAKFVHEHAPEVKIHYYIPPKVWAWNSSRIKLLDRYCDEIHSILPFEEQWFREHGLGKVQYVGNPTMQEVEEYLAANPYDIEALRNDLNIDSRPIIALLPGSRRQEIQKNLPLMFKAVKTLTDEYNIIIAATSDTDPVLLGQNASARVTVCLGQTYRILQHATAAVVTSGTATLETALFSVPQVICYRTALPHLASWLRRKFLHIKYISLVNLIADAPVVAELIAADATAENIRKELLDILNPETKKRGTIKQGYDLIRQRLRL